MRRKSLISVISKWINTPEKSSNSKKRTKTASKKIATSKPRVTSSTISKPAQYTAPIKPGLVYTALGSYTKEDYSVIEEANKYAYAGDFEKVENLIDQNPSVFKPADLHFIYNNLQAEVYKKREDPFYLNKAKEICMKDYELLKSGNIDFLLGARLPCMDRLITICEKTKDITTAIEVLRFAVDKKLDSKYQDKLDKHLAATTIESVW